MADFHPLGLVVTFQLHVRGRHIPASIQLPNTTRSFGDVRSDAGGPGGAHRM
jgi:hypothetical protein